METQAGHWLQGSPCWGSRQLTALARTRAVVVFAAAAGAAEEVAVADAALHDGLAEGVADVLLSGQVGEGAGAPFAVIDWR